MYTGRPSFSTASITPSVNLVVQLAIYDAFLKLAPDPRSAVAVLPDFPVYQHQQRAPEHAVYKQRIIGCWLWRSRPRGNRLHRTGAPYFSRPYVKA